MWCVWGCMDVACGGRRYGWHDECDVSVCGPNVMDVVWGRGGQVVDHDGEGLLQTPCPLHDADCCHGCGVDGEVLMTYMCGGLVFGVLVARAGGLVLVGCVCVFVRVFVGPCSGYFGGLAFGLGCSSSLHGSPWVGVTPSLGKGAPLLLLRLALLRVCEGDPPPGCESLAS